MSDPAQDDAPVPVEPQGQPVMELVKQMKAEGVSSFSLDNLHVTFNPPEAKGVATKNQTPDEIAQEKLDLRYAHSQG